MLNTSLDKPILLFDGVCNLCNGFVQFVIKRDSKERYLFTSLQSKAGQEILAKVGLPQDEISTVVLYDRGKVYTHSDVALRMVKDLGGLWPLLAVFSIIPKSIRDQIYNWVARNRYNWFGQRDSCMLPTPELKDRFL